VAEQIYCSNTDDRVLEALEITLYGDLIMYQYGTKEWDKAYASMIEERRNTEPAPFVLGTPEWVSEFEKKIQVDDRYKEVAQKWEGSVVLVFKADPQAGFDNDVFLFMDLWHGECRSARLVPPEIGRSGEYVLEAEYDRWKRILKKELNVVKEMATRKLKLVPFDFKKAAKLTAAAQAAIRLVDLGSDVGTRFPDELEAEQAEAFKALLQELKTEFGI
jgi:putative sterol carrier protein